MIQIFVFIAAMLFALPVFADENCNSLSCVDKPFIKANIIKYFEVLGRSLEEAKGCNNIREIFEFAPTIRGSVASEEMISKFVEHEFMDNPACVLEQLEQSSPSAQYIISHFLAFPTYVEGKLIKEKLYEYIDSHTEAVSLIFNGH